MILGVDIDAQTERLIWEAFDGWADHFKHRLASGGVPSLIDSYEELLRSLETQSCSHGAEWRSCCGISYEYLNDLSVRDALQIIIDATPNPEANRLKALIDPLDSRLKIQLFGSTEPHAGKEPARASNRPWWRVKLPDVVEPCERSGR